MNKAAKQVKKKARSKPKARKKGAPFFPTGLTPLNLALADDPNLGWKKGSVVNIIGDTHTGKSMLGFLTLAASAHDPRLDKFRLIYDDAEAAMAFDIKKLFGKKTARRVETMHPDRKPKYSRTVEDFLYGLLELLDNEIPFVCVEDSLDALTSEADLEYMESTRKAWKKGEDHAGSYGTDKAKKMSELFRNIVDRVEQSDSLLLIISQTRANINPRSFKKKTRSGGNALDFYAAIIMWLAHEKVLTAKINKKTHTIGNRTKISISKNKYTGKQGRRLSFETFYDYGVDNIGSCIDWLLENDIWKKKKGGIQAEFESIDILGSRKGLIETIERDNLEDELTAVVGEAWMEIEESLKLGRKDRFK